MIHKHIGPERLLLWDSKARGGRPDSMKILKEAYSYWDAEDVIRYGGTLTVAAYRGLRQHEADDQQQLGEGMKMLNDMMSGSKSGQCALATNGTTGAKTPGCP